MRSKLEREDGADAEQAQALGGPVARRAGAVALAGHEHHRLLRRAVALGDAPERQDFAVGTWIV